MKIPLDHELKKKYIFNHEDKKELIPLGKKILKLIIVIAVIKITRVFLVVNNTVNKTITEIFAIAPPEELFRFFALMIMVFGFIILFCLYLIKGKNVIKHQLFMYIMLFCIVDMLFIYIFPEIPSSIFKAIFGTA